MLSLSEIIPISFTNDLFSLTIIHTRYATTMTMFLRTAIINTREIPYTFPVLKENLPSILIAQCFNDDNIPFAQEVKSTEIGHLFEHIMLEHLCLLKLAQGHKKATYRGETNWNWKRDIRGTFHIHINSSFKDEDIFDEALNRSIELTVKIIQTRKEYAFDPPVEYSPASLSPFVSSQGN